jgi:hypothetical protein
LKQVNRQVAQFAKQMKKAAVDDDTYSTSSSSNKDGDGKSKDSDMKSRTGSNRNNPSLTRQKKVQVTDSKK